MTQDSITPPNQLSKTETQPTYTEKTDRLNAITQLLKIIKPFLFVIFIIIVVSWGGKFLINNSLSTSPSFNDKQESTEVTIKIPEKQDIDQEIISALHDAKVDAKNFASAELDQWVTQLMTRVDDSFLPWYFGYFNQKLQELRTPFIYLVSTVKHWINTNQPSPNQVVAERLTEEIQTEFSKRVLQPKLSQLQLENITRNTTNRYVDKLKDNLSNLQSQYNIPQAEWERYLNDMAITITDAQGNVSSLSMKFLVGGSTYLLAKAMLPVATKGSVLMLSLVGKSSAKMAAKTGGIAAAKIGAHFIDPLVVFGIMIWDLWDYHHTVNVEQPILRDAIKNYLQEVKEALLDNNTNSIMSSIYQVENGIIEAL